MEGGRLPETCCDQQIIKAEKGRPAIPKESLLFAPVFIDDNIWIFTNQYEVSLRKWFNNKGFTEKNPKKTKKKHPRNLNGNKFPGPEDSHLKGEK